MKNSDLEGSKKRDGSKKREERINSKNCNYCWKLGSSAFICQVSL